MQLRNLGRKDDLSGDSGLQIDSGQPRHRAGRAVMMGLFGIQVGRCIAITGTLVFARVKVTMTMVMRNGSRNGRSFLSMRSNRAGMKAGKDQPDKAEEGYETAHLGRR